MIDAEIVIAAAVVVVDCNNELLDVFSCYSEH